HYTDTDLQEMFRKEAFELASLHYHDEEYFKFFTEYLRNQYIKDGYVQVRVQGPNVLGEQDEKTRVEYNIIEGRRAYVRNISFQGINPEFQEKVLQVLSNKAGNPFNPTALVEDIKLVALTLQESGHYFAEVVNANDDTLVTYTKTAAEVDINFN